MEKPNIVFLPAFMCTENLFKDQYNKLKEHYNVIIPVLKDFTNISEAANYILSIAPKEFYLIGISMGGYIAMEMLTIAKDRIKKLCLMATKIDLDTEQQKQYRLNSIKTAKDTKNIKATNSYISSMLHCNINNQSVYTLIQNMNTSLGVDIYVNQQMLILSRKDLFGRLKDFYKPTLLIGASNDTITPISMLEKISKEIPGSILVTIENCGHLIPLDQPVALTTLLEYFIKI